MSEPSSCLPSQPVDLKSLRSRITELGDVDGNSEHDTEATQKLMNNIADELEKKINWISSEWSSNLSTLPSEDLDEILGQLKKEMGQVEGENIAVGQEIEELERRCVEDYDKVESELEKLQCSLEFIQVQSYEGSKENMQIDVSCHADDQADFSNEHDYKFKMLELSHQIEKSRTTLKSLQDLDSIFKRFNAVEKIEDSLTGLKVIEIEGNSVRLSLKTYIPYLETILRQQEIENIIEPLEMNHELMIETLDGTWELKNVEIFPNDVYIGEIVDATKALRQLYPTFSVIENRSSLECFVRRVQDRIALSSLRRFVVKNANKSRHSFEYLDREDTIVTHVAGGIDAYIKLPQGWPLSDFALELISLKSTSQYSKEISLSFLCKIVGMANSSNTVSISKFADSIEEMLMQQMREQLHPDTSVTSN
ncbi:hypothetical protein ACS0TY_014745 [Phlomoides rotata]